MGDPKFSTFIVGLIFVSAVAAIFALLMSDMATNYGVTYSGNESTGILDKLGELNTSARLIKSSVEGTDTTKQSWLTKLGDIVGGIFLNGINTVKIVWQSFDIFETMLTEGLNRMGLGVTLDIVRTAIISSVIIIIFVGIVVSILVKRET